MKWFIRIVTVLCVATIASAAGQPLLKAQSTMLSGNYTAAVSQLERLLKQEPQNTQALILLGHAYSALQRYDQALAVFERAVKLEPENTAILFALGKTRLQLGHLTEAEKIFRQMLRRDSAFIAARIQLAKLFIQKESYAEALPLYESLLREQPGNGFYLKQAGICAYKLGRRPAAIRYFHKALEQNPRDAASYVYLFNLYKKKEDWQAALQIAANGLHYYPRSAKLHLARGDAFFEQKKYDQAVGDYLQAMDAGDSSAYLFKKLGLSYYHIDDLAAALLALQNAVRKDKEDPLSLYYLGLTYKELGAKDKAIQRLNQTIRAAIPSYIADVYFELADSYQQNGQYEQALGAYQKVYEFDPQRKLIWFYIAMIYDRHLKERQTALRYYQRFLEEAPEEMAARYREWTLERMKSLREAIHFENGRKESKQNAKEKTRGH